jgi:O-antigen/teichoic acid export membrane protein
MMSVTGSLAIAGMSTVIFDQLLGPAYSAGGKILSILVWSSVPVFLGMATSQIIVNDKLYWVSLFRTSLGMLISLALVAPAALRFGVNGVAVVVIGSACMATLAILVSPSARQTISQVCKFKRVAQ